MRAGTYHRGGRQQSVRHLVQLGGLLVLRDFRFRYRQAYLGYLWAVARPLFAVLPLILVGNAFGLGGEDMGAAEYALFALSGFLLWQVFWDAVISPSGSPAGCGGCSRRRRCVPRRSWRPAPAWCCSTPSSTAHSSCWPAF